MCEPCCRRKRRKMKGNRKKFVSKQRRRKPGKKYRCIKKKIVKQSNFSFNITYPHAPLVFNFMNTSYTLEKKTNFPLFTFPLFSRVFFFVSCNDIPVFFLLIWWVVNMEIIYPFVSCKLFILFLFKTQMRSSVCNASDR